MPTGKRKTQVSELNGTHMHNPFQTHPKSQNYRNVFAMSFGSCIYRA